MKMIKTILKSILRIIASLMYIPLLLLSIGYTVLVLIFVLVSAGISFILTGDMDIIPNRIADALEENEKYKNIFCLLLLCEEDKCVVLNYNTMVFDKINEW